MKRIGICGSDVEYWKKGKIGDFILKKPMVIGHESSGIVDKIGKNVNNLKVGDRVALEPGVPCRQCELCKKGIYNLCSEMKFFATPPIDGSLCQYVCHPHDFCYKLPENVSYDDGAMCEPLSVGVHACQRANIQPGSTVAILGSGPIGLVCAMVAKAFGARKVVMSDVREERLTFAKKVVADSVVLIKNDIDVVQQLKDSVDKEIDATIECSGFESSMKSALAITKSGGVVCCVGLHDSTMNLPLMDANVREVDIKGIFRYRNTYPICIALIESGKVDIKELITHRFKLDEVEEAFEMARTGKDAIKVMFELND